MTHKQTSEVAQWLSAFRNSCDRGGIAVSITNETFRTAETFFWIGLMTGLGPSTVPQEITLILTQGKSPLLEYKVKRTRGPRAKKTDKAPPGEVFN